MPTETVYGLAADAADPRAVAAVYEAKGRPAFNPLIAHVADVETARRIARFDARAEALAARFWPGPLTLVLPVADPAAVCDLARAGLDTVAVRAPAHPVARALLARFGRPVVAPSANRSGRPSPTTLADALEETGAAAAAALDGGPCAVGLESTVVALLEAPRLLRPGAVTRAEIEAVVGPLLDAEADAKRSPGRLTRHYAPNAPVRLEAEAPRAGEAWLSFGPQGAGPFNLSPSGDLAEAAANLFAHLRAADRTKPAGIAVAPIPAEGLGEAINDRLRRADVGQGEIVTLVEQGRVERLGQGVGEAVGEIQPGAMAALAIAAIGFERGRIQLYVLTVLDTHAGKPVQEAVLVGEQAALHQDHAGLDVAYRREKARVGPVQDREERVPLRLPVGDRDQGGGIDNDQPSSSRPGISLSSSHSSFVTGGKGPVTPAFSYNRSVAAIISASVSFRRLGRASASAFSSASSMTAVSVCPLRPASSRALRSTAGFLIRIAMAAPIYTGVYTGGRTIGSLPCRP
jgi:L-threonylcarbamoyladenylate synthase